VNLCPNDYISRERELFTTADGVKVQACDDFAYPLTHDQDARRRYAVSYATLTQYESEMLYVVAAVLAQSDE
jgi:hypothetical protein